MTIKNYEQEYLKILNQFTKKKYEIFIANLSCLESIDL